LCAACEKISENVMTTVSEYNQIHWFCQYCNAIVSRAIGQACTIENAVQSSVSLYLKEIVNEFTKMVNQAKECLKPKTPSLEVTMVMEAYDDTENS